MNAQLSLPQGQILSYSRAIAFAAVVPPASGTGQVVFRRTRALNMTPIGILTLRLALQAAIVAGWTAGKLKLYSNNVTPAFDSEIGFFTEANFPGYAEIDAAGAPFAGIDAATGQLVVAWADPVSWNAGTIVTPQMIYGWYITNTAETSVLVAGRFATPVNINATDMVLVIEAPQARIPNAIVS